MLWVKAFHIIFIASWFAALFYLPRILVNLAQVSPHTSAAEYQRLIGMAQRLYRFSIPLALCAIASGLWLWLGYGSGAAQVWLYVKLALVVMVVGYWHGCAVLLARFVRGENQRTHQWFRLYNELAVVLFAAIVLLVVLRPGT